MEINQRGKMSIPNILRFKDGQLTTVNGEGVTDYLNNWAKEHEISHDMPINLIPHSELNRINEEIISLNSRVFCSFCCRHKNEVRRIIAGLYAFICDECILVCVDILKDDDRLSECEEGGESESEN